jgi:hypothetical protein
MRGAMERAVRPFVEIDSAPINRIFRRPDPPPEQLEATITWGASSQFILPPQSVTQPETGGPIRINWPQEEEEEEVPGPWTWTEVSRETSNFRVENPDDPSQYLIVQRIDRMTMSDSRDGETVILVFRNP